MLSQASPETHLPHGHLSNPPFSSRSSRSIPPRGPSKVQPFYGFPSSQCPRLLRSASSPHPRSMALLRTVGQCGMGIGQECQIWCCLWYGPCVRFFSGSSGGDAFSLQVWNKTPVSSLPSPPVSAFVLLWPLGSGGQQRFQTFS